MTDNLLALLKAVSKARLTPREIYSVQKQLVDRISQFEKLIARVSARISRCSARKGSGEEIQRLRKLKEDLGWHRASYRLIGDTLLFRFVPSYLARRLNNNTDPGWLFKKKGLKLEMSTAKAIANNGDVAILADTTHCLRVGDILAIGKKRFALIEMKSGGKTKDEDQLRREARQRRRLELTLQLLHGTFPGLVTVEAGSGKSYWSIAEAMLRRALKSPQFKKVEPGQFLCAFRHSDNERASKLIGRKIQVSALIAPLSDRVKEHPTIEPFTLHLPPFLARKIISGELGLWTLIDIPFLTRKMAAIGLEPVIHNNVIHQFRAKDGYLMASTYQLLTVSFCLRSLKDIVLSYKASLKEYAKFPSSAGQTLDPATLEDLKLLGREIPDELMRRIQ